MSEQATERRDRLTTEIIAIFVREGLTHHQARNLLVNIWDALAQSPVAPQSLPVVTNSTERMYDRMDRLV